MKVLFVAHSSDLSGGANRSLLGVMKGLREDWGVEPSVLLPGANGELQQVCLAENIPVYAGNYRSCCTVYRHGIRDVLRFCKLFAVPLKDWFSARKLSEKLPHDFDLIYTNERMVVIGAYLARLRKVPHIWHVRSFARENATHYPPFYYRLMDKNARRIVLISNALYRSFARHIAAKKLRMVHNGVSPAEYGMGCRPPRKGYKLLLTGRIVPPKGQMEALQALHILCRKSDYPFELYFAGDIPTYDGGDYKRKLENYISEAGLRDRVHFLGEVRNISGLRREMDMELVCSWCETFGRVTVEAMCAGLPVIGSDAGGTAEIIVHGETGLLYRPHDAGHLAESILWCFEHPAEVSEMVEAGCKRAMECFTMDAAVRNIYAVISEVLGEEEAGT